MLMHYAIPAFKDNYIWFIKNVRSESVLIVDPGDAVPVKETLEKYGWRPEAILITHGCHDHVDGIASLQADFSLPVFGPSNEFIPYLTHPLSECEGVRIHPDFPAISVLAIPGHTLGHIGFLIAGALFCGDTLFGAGCGRLHGNPPHLLFHSLQKIAQLPPDTRIYCAHEYTLANLAFAECVEPENQAIQQRIRETKHILRQHKPTLPSTLELELATNPFLRCDQAAVKQAVQVHFDQPVASDLAVFSLLRQWKDSF